MTERDTTIEDWVARMAPDLDEVDAQLPPHSAECLGCGPDNPGGYHLSVRRSGQAVVAEYTFGPDQVGAPGIAHGGAVAAVLDDLFGFLLYVVGEPGVTRRLAIDYRSPVMLGRPYDLRASIAQREGRKLFLSATLHDRSGEAAATAEAVFILVGASHFDRSP